MVLVRGLPWGGFLQICDVSARQMGEEECAYFTQAPLTSSGTRDPTHREHREQTRGCVSAVLL